MCITLGTSNKQLRNMESPYRMCTTFPTRPPASWSTWPPASWSTWPPASWSNQNNLPMLSLHRASIVFSGYLCRSWVRRNSRGRPGEAHQVSIPQRPRRWGVRCLESSSCCRGSLAGLSKEKRCVMCFGPSLFQRTVKDINFEVSFF